MMKQLVMIIVLAFPVSGYAADINSDSLMSCVIKPNKEVKVSSQVSGVVQKIKLKKGDWVKKGSVIASLQAGQERARLKTAKAKENFARRKLDRYNKMIQQDLVAKDEIDQMRTDLDIARLEVKEIHSLIKLKTIFSPVSGYVKEINVSQGEYVGTNPIIEVVDISKLYAEILVREQLFGQIKKNQKIPIRILSPVNESRQAVVRQIDKTIDPASGSFGLRAYFPNSKNTIPAGVDCTIGGENDT